MPIISAEVFRSGPPELPGFIAASVWIMPVITRPPLLLGSDRFVLETMPVVSVWSSPNGLPSAYAF